MVLGATVGPLPVRPTDGRLTWLVVGSPRGRKVTARLFQILIEGDWI